MKTVQTDTPVEISYELEDIILNVNQAIPCALIINELVTNALKHAFRGLEKGKIRISLKEKEGLVSLSVRDNGIGLPENFKLEETDSLGMLITKTLIKQLDASANFTSENGSAFTIQFARADVKGIGSHHLN